MFQLAIEGPFSNSPRNQSPGAMWIHSTSSCHLAPCQCGDGRWRKDRTVRCNGGQGLEMPSYPCPIPSCWPPCFLLLSFIPLLPRLLFLILSVFSLLFLCLSCCPCLIPSISVSFYLIPSFCVSFILPLSPPVFSPICISQSLSMSASLFLSQYLSISLSLALHSSILSSLIFLPSSHYCSTLTPQPVSFWSSQ